MIISFQSQNLVNSELVYLLQENNVASPDVDDCDYLHLFVQSWLRAADSVQPDSWMLPTNAYLLYAEMLPIRCPFQAENGRITICRDPYTDNSTCIWGPYDMPIYDELDDLPMYFAKNLDIRVGGIRTLSQSSDGFAVKVLFNDNFTVSFTYVGDPSRVVFSM